MTIGTYQRKVTNFGLRYALDLGDGELVVSFNEPIAKIAVNSMEVEAANVAL